MKVKISKLLKKTYKNKISSMAMIIKLKRKNKKMHWFKTIQ